MLFYGVRRVSTIISYEQYVPITELKDKEKMLSNYQNSFYMCFSKINYSRFCESYIYFIPKIKKVNALGKNSGDALMSE